MYILVDSGKGVGAIVVGVKTLDLDIRVTSLEKRVYF